MRLINQEYLDFDNVLILPHRSELKSRSEVNLERTFKFKHSTLTWTGIPILASNMSSTGLFEVFDVLKNYKMGTILHKHYTVDEYVNFYNRVPDEELQYAWYSLGMRGGDLEKFQEVQSKVGNRIQYICLDVPSAYLQTFSDYLKKFRSLYPNAVIMAGNVATGEMAEQLVLDGADIVKCGIGNGSHCLTRRVTGVGSPILSTIIEAADHAHGLDGRIVCDGGIVHPGDLAKAFGANSDFIIIGSVFAAHDQNSFDVVDEMKEYPAVNEKGEFTGKFITVPTGRKLAKVFGMSSHEAQMKFYGKIEKHRSSEGRESLIPLKGDLNDTVYHFLGGLASSCTYVGAKNLKELAKRTTFIKVNKQLSTAYGS